MNKFIKLVTKTICLCFLALPLLALANNVQLKSTLKKIEVKHDTMFPESIAYNPISKRFVLGSFRLGAIYEVDENGNTRKAIEDERLRSVFAISIDNQRNRLYALTSDLGVSIRTKHDEVKHYAALGIYNLSTGKAIDFIKLSNIIPNSEYLVNGMTLDDAGNVYITDSFAAAIYKVDPNGEASLFLKDEQFTGEGINLNGIVFHKDGYLIVAQKSNGILYKIPIHQPEEFSAIKSNKRYLGADGLILANDNTIIIIANRVPGHNTDTAFMVSTNDDWKTMQTNSSYSFGNVYPTTGILINNKIYAIYSKLNQLVLVPKDEKSKLRYNAIIEQIGRVMLESVK